MSWLEGILGHCRGRFLEARRILWGRRGGAATERRREARSFPLPIPVVFRGKCLPCGHLCRCSIGKGARKERNSNDRVREDTVKGWLSSELCLLKLGTEFSGWYCLSDVYPGGRAGQIFGELGFFQVVRGSSFHWGSNASVAGLKVVFLTSGLCVMYMQLSISLAS